MKADEIRELFVYNAWANRRIFDALAALPTEQYHRDLKCSFASIHGTLAHIVGAEQLWLNRWRGQPGTMLKGSDVGSLAELRTIWDRVETERRDLLNALTDDRVESRITVKTASGEFAHTLQQTLQHAVDHSSYHRGQIVTLLRQLGVQPPTTGLIAFYRNKLQAS